MGFARFTRTARRFAEVSNAMFEKIALATGRAELAKKKRFMVVPRTTGVQQTGIKTGKGQLTFGKKTAQWIDDPAVAKEIDTQYGLKGTGDVWVAQDENLEWHEKHDGLTDGKMKGIHNYTFAGVDMEKKGGNKRVKVKTNDGFTYMAEAVAIEMGYEIVEKGKKNEGLRKELSKKERAA